MFASTGTSRRAAAMPAAELGRARNALALILEKFIAKELQAWVQTFPEDFYREMFRLRGLDYPQFTVKRPQYFGTLTNDIVYRRLAPGVLDELKRVTPRDGKGRRKYKSFSGLRPTSATRSCANILAQSLRS